MSGLIKGLKLTHQIVNRNPAAVFTLVRNRKSHRNVLISLIILTIKLYNFPIFNLFMYLH
jgi:hypothetical protein